MEMLNKLWNEYIRKMLKKLWETLGEYKLQISLELIALLLMFGAVFSMYEVQLGKNKYVVKDRWDYYISRLNSAVESEVFGYERTYMRTDTMEGLFASVSGLAMYDPSFRGFDYTAICVMDEDTVLQGDWLKLESSEIGSQLWMLDGANKSDFLKYYQKLIQKGRNYRNRKYYLSEGVNTLYVDAIRVAAADNGYELVDVTFASLLTDETFTLNCAAESYANTLTLKLSQETGAETGYSNAAICVGSRSRQEALDAYYSNENAMVRVSHTFHFGEYSADLDALINVKDYTLDSTFFQGLTAAIFAIGQLITAILICTVNYWNRKKKNYAEMRNLFLNGIAHEMKTPAAAIINGVECIEQSVNPDKNDHYMQIVSNEANHLNEQLNNMLTYTRLADTTNKVALRRMDVTELVESILEHYRMGIEKKGIVIEKDLKYPFFLDTNEELVKLVLDNYISNAVKHCVRGGRILITSGADSIHVYNDGPNIKKANLKKIWEPLFMEDESRKKYDSSTGMGLAISSCALQILKLRYGVKNLEGGVEFFFKKKSFWNAVDAVKDFFGKLFQKKLRICAAVTAAIVLICAVLAASGAVDLSLLKTRQKRSDETVFAIQEENLIALDQINGRLYNTTIGFTLVSDNPNSFIFDEDAIERSVLYRQRDAYYSLDPDKIHADGTLTDEILTIKNLRGFLNPKREMIDGQEVPTYQHGVCVLSVNKELSDAEAVPMTVGDKTYYSKEMVFDIKCDANEVRVQAYEDALLLQFANGAFASVQIGNTAFLNHYRAMGSWDFSNSMQCYTSELVPVSFKMLGRNEENHNPKAAAITVRALRDTVITGVSDKCESNHIFLRTDKAVVLKQSVEEIDEQEIFAAYPQLLDTDDTYYWDYLVNYGFSPEAENCSNAELEEREQYRRDRRELELDEAVTNALDYRLAEGEECTIIVPLEYHSAGLLDKCAIYVNDTPVTFDFACDSGLITAELVETMSGYGTAMNGVYEP